MFNNMELLSNDPHLIQVAIKLGYTPEDLAQITIENVEEESQSVIKGMSEIEQSFYLKKKLQALQTRQKKIFTHVCEELNKQGSKKSRSFHHPLTSKLLIDHQHALDKKKRYDKIKELHAREKTSHQHKTIDLGRTSPNFSNISHNSRVSRNSANSACSSRSRASTTSHKERLHMLRQKQKDSQQYKKRLFLQNQSKSRNKLQSVRNSRQSLSRRLKTRSQISKQAVMQKKAELESIRTKEMREEIQKTKYKAIRNDYIRQKQLDKKKNYSVNQDIKYKQQIKKMFEENQKTINRQKYQTRMRNASMKQYELAVKKAQTMDLKKKDQLLRFQQVNRYREHLELEQNHKKERTILYENKNFERAERIKNEIQSMKKMKILENKVKQEIAKNNYSAIERRKKVEAKEKAKRITEKMNNIAEFQQFKKRLEYERKTTGYSQKKQRFSFN